MFEHLSCGEGSIQDEIRQAINAYLSRRERAGYREVVLSPRSTVDVDQMLSWLASKSPLLKDLQGNNDELHELILKPMRASLSPIQLRRTKSWIMGEKLSVIGRTEGVSKQAIHASINRSLKALADSYDFVHGLCELFPESGLTPSYLMAALKEAEHVKQQ